jgi:ADP-ribosylglycohydrolase
MVSRREEAYAGVLSVVAAIRACVRASGVPADLLEAVASVLPDTRVRDRVVELQGFSGTADAAAARFGCSGHVVEAVPLALFIATAGKAGTLADAVRQAVSLGGDSDTIAAIVGQLSGAAGMSPPIDLVGRIAGIREVEVAVERFAALVTRDGDPG